VIETPGAEINRVEAAGSPQLSATSREAPARKIGQRAVDTIADVLATGESKIPAGIFFSGDQ